MFSWNEGIGTLLWVAALALAVARLGWGYWSARAHGVSLRQVIDGRLLNGAAAVFCLGAGLSLGGVWVLFWGSVALLFVLLVVIWPHGAAPGG